MSGKLVRRLTFWAVMVFGVLAPFLVASACSGWNEGSMQVASCSPDWPFLYGWANVVYGMLLLSAFTVGIPILIYLAVLWLIAFAASRVAARAYGGKR